MWQVLVERTLRWFAMNAQPPKGIRQPSPWPRNRKNLETIKAKRWIAALISDPVERNNELNSKDYDGNVIQLQA